MKNTSILLLNKIFFVNFIVDHIIEFLISDYGVLGLILIIVGALAFFLYKELKKNNDKMLESQNKLNSDLTTSLNTNFTNLTTSLVQNLQSQNDKLLDVLINGPKIKHDAGLLERFNIAQEINTKLKDLTILCEADRGLIIEFHNSFENLTGFPFAKYTATYEHVNKGCLSIIHKCSNMPYSSIAPIIEQICAKHNDDHMFIVNGMDQLCSYTSSLHSLLSPVADSVVWKALFDTNKNSLIGLLALEYKQGIPVVLDKEAVKITANVIAELITLKKHQIEAS